VVEHDPTVAGETVYAGTEAGGLHALGAADGDQRWQVDLGERAAGSPVHAGDRVAVVVGTTELHADQRVLAFDEGGKRRWAFAPESWWLTVHGADDRAVYVGTNDDVIETGGQTLYALDRVSGDERWRVEIGDSYRSAFTDDTIATTSYGRLYAIDRNDGTERWSVDIEDVGALRATDGTVFVQTGHGSDGAVRAYDIRTGEERWQFGEWSVGSLTLADGLYAGGGQLGRLALDTGEPRWRVEGPSFVPQSPVVEERIVADGDAVAAYATDDGTEAWTARPERTTPSRTHGPGDEPVPEILVPETVAGGAGFVRGAGNAASQHRAYAYALDSGEERWQFDTGGALTGFASDGERAYAGSANGRVHAFRSSTVA
jgi:outer membrane protein assembly factor BamB